MSTEDPDGTDDADSFDETGSTAEASTAGDEAGAWSTWSYVPPPIDLDAT